MVAFAGSGGLNGEVGALDCEAEVQDDVWLVFSQQLGYNIKEGMVFCFEWFIEGDDFDGLYFVGDLRGELKDDLK